MVNPFEVAKLIETVAPETGEIAAALINRTGINQTGIGRYLTSLATSQLEAASGTSSALKAHLPHVEIDALTKSLSEAVQTENWANVRKPAESLIQGTEGNPSRFTENTFGRFQLARIDHLDGNLPAAEDGFKKVIGSTTDFRSWTNQRSRFFEEYSKMLKTGGRDEEAAVKDAHVLGLRAQLPDVSGFDGPFSVDESYFLPGEAADHASWKAHGDAFFHDKYPDGFWDRGEIFSFQKPIRTIIDTENDPILKQTLHLSEAAFSGLKDPTQSATALAEYTRRLFPKADVPEYFSWREQNVGSSFFLGENVRTGLGVCNQHMLMFKTLADARGLQASAYRGGLGTAFHDFNTVHISGTEKLFDTTTNRINEVFAPGKEYKSPFGSNRWE
jgi:hypothetical protein